MIKQTAWKGSKRKLVLAFDLGTTYSGVSYSILNPGEVPTVKAVTKFPFQEGNKGISKVPSVIYYDQDGHVKAIGAETQTEETYQDVLAHNWIKAEWFKIHLSHPNHADGKDITSHIPPLPPNKSIVAVIADFLEYLRECAEAFVRDTEFEGDRLWDSVEDNIDYIFGHPNGWESAERIQLRRAAVHAELVPSMDACRSRILLVTEGEASLHYAITHGLLLNEPNGNNGVVIIDAGGGTIDISAYRPTSDPEDKGLGFEEISIPKSGLYGSALVRINAQTFLGAFLKGSQFIDDLDDITHCFDETTKLRFCDDQKSYYVHFGTKRDHDETYGIRSGQLRLEGSDIATFFKPSVDWIVDAVLTIKRESPHQIYHVVFVGGFSKSDWLYQQVRTRLAEEALPSSLCFTRPHADSPINKAVSDGAMHSYLNRFVSGRLSRITYGVISRTRYDATNPEHVKRKDLIEKSSEGELLLPGHFTVFLAKGTRVRGSTELRQNLTRHCRTLADLTNITSHISIYRGEDKSPEWTDVDKDNFKTLCVVRTNLSMCIPELHKKKNAQGDTWHEVTYTVILSVGLESEFKAELAWKDGGDGVEKRGPATIIYDPQDEDE